MTYPPPHPPWWGLRVQKVLIMTTLDHWKRHFQEQNYIENYFYSLKSTKSTKTTSQNCWRNIIWVDFFWHPYWSNSIKTCQGLPGATPYSNVFCSSCPTWNSIYSWSQTHFEGVENSKQMQLSVPYSKWPTLAVHHAWDALLGIVSVYETGLTYTAIFC